MTDPNALPAVRLRAAECVFEIAIKGIEIDDIEGRVAELEAAAPQGSTIDEQSRWRAFANGDA